MSDALAQLSIDDAAISRAADALAAKGIVIDADLVREVLSALADQEAAPVDPVSFDMIAAGRAAWLNNPSAPVHVLLPAIYLAMDAAKPVQVADPAVVAEPPVPLNQGIS